MLLSLANLPIEQEAQAVDDEDPLPALYVPSGHVVQEL
jgi:hypothetical protein